jgi:hypothetical protein
MIEALRKMHMTESPSPAVFFFALRGELRTSNPIAHIWRDANGREVRLT